MKDLVEKDDAALETRPAGQGQRRADPATRLVVVTSRQPNPAVATQGNSGGLVAALAPAIERNCGTWISGRPVDKVTASGTWKSSTAAEAAYRSVSVRYPAELHEGFYAGLSNGVLWPLYHSLLQDIGACRSADWRDYQRVNQHFAAVSADQCVPGSFVWVHDYQLSLVPALLRDMIPASVSIGFFLHTPFPGYDVFRTLPWAREILQGMLAADIIGFHTDDYRHNFSECVSRLLGIPCEPDAEEVLVDGRSVKLRAIPVGIDVQAIYRLLEDPWVKRAAAQLRSKIGADQLILGVDRMDYTKGIDRRLEAVDQLLDQHKEMRGRIVYAQIAVPSRVEVDGYQRLRCRLEQMAGSINGRWGTGVWSPVNLVCRSYPLRELVAWYLAADVALVTPLRDGMNLVAKEYCAAHRDLPGTLVLSELAGAAGELSDALLVNPYDIDALTTAIHRALTMPEDEARQRMQLMNQRIQGHDAHHWVDSFLAEAGWRNGR